MRAKRAIDCLAKNARRSHGAPRSLDRQKRAARDDNGKLSHYLTGETRWGHKTAFPLPA
jgi:hypothetical protein